MSSLPHVDVGGAQRAVALSCGVSWADRALGTLNNVPALDVLQAHHGGDCRDAARGRDQVQERRHHDVADQWIDRFERLLGVV